MPPSLLASQLATLEEVDLDDSIAVFTDKGEEVHGFSSPEEIVRQLLRLDGSKSVL